MHAYCPLAWAFALPAIPALPHPPREPLLGVAREQALRVHHDEMLLVRDDVHAADVLLRGWRLGEAVEVDDDRHHARRRARVIVDTTRGTCRSRGRRKVDEGAAIMAARGEGHGDVPGVGGREDHGEKEDKEWGGPHSVE